MIDSMAAAVGSGVPGAIGAPEAIGVGIGVAPDGVGDRDAAGLELPVEGAGAAEPGAPVGVLDGAGSSVGVGTGVVTSVGTGVGDGVGSSVGATRTLGRVPAGTDAVTGADGLGDPPGPPGGTAPEASGVAGDADGTAITYMA